MPSGVYTITTPEGQQYVGSTVSLYDRRDVHLANLRHGKHYNKALTRAFAKHGEAGLAFRPLLICSREMLIFYEQRAMDVLKPECNEHPRAGTALGFKHSSETIAKISASNIGKNLGRVVSGEVRARIADGIRKTTPADLPQILAMRKSGMTCEAIGHRFNVSKTTIRSVLKKAGAMKSVGCNWQPGYR